jgi:mannonate dehydratase
LPEALNPPVFILHFPFSILHSPLSVMNRRNFLSFLGLLTVGSTSLSSCSIITKYWPDNGTFFNPCKKNLPAALTNHDVILSAFEGVDTTQIWDGHVHLIGLGDSKHSGVWVHPHSKSWSHPWLHTQFIFFLNASCPVPNMTVDDGYVTRLRSLRWGRGVRFLLLAFDYAYNEKGERLPQRSAFYTPNEYAARLHQQWPDTFEWIASIHPYRQDCVEALEKAFRQGARGVKWLPPAMGMNPASPLCKRFYEAMVRLDLPLLCHGGVEHAVHGMNMQELGNPLALRYPLELGVKVVVAHCASVGNSPDLDRCENGPLRRNFDLFTRLLDEPRYEKLLFGDISAMSQVTRAGPDLEKLLSHPEWHSQLLYGSDYPLPGLGPATSLKFLKEKKYITAPQAQVLAQVRQYNSLLFDFALNRHLQVEGKRFSAEIFQTRPFWTGAKFWKFWKKV